MRNVDHTQIINLFGGIRALAKGLKHKNASTVQGWKERRFVPGRRQHELLDLAKKMGVPLTPSDFFQCKPNGKRRAGKGTAKSHKKDA